VNEEALAHWEQSRQNKKIKETKVLMVTFWGLLRDRNISDHFSLACRFIVLILIVQKLKKNFYFKITLN